MKGNRVVKRLRTELGFTQAEFGEEVDLAGVYVAQIETGVHGLGRDAALKILDRFRGEMMERRITLEDLLRGEGRAA
jgi:transcriptional regulator with XRE-family HTH domain